jgi:hypothetical protein
VNGQRASEAFGGQCAVSYMKGEMKFAKKFQRIDPGFESSGFAAEKSRASADDGEEFPGADGALEFKRLSGLLGGRYNAARQTDHEQTDVAEKRNETLRKHCDLLLERGFGLAGGLQSRGSLNIRNRGEF